MQALNRPLHLRPAAMEGLYSRDNPWRVVAVLPAGGKLVIINLQATPKDKKAHLVIHARVDQVMRGVMAKLAVAIPAYVREDSVAVSHCQEQPASNGYPFSLSIASVHGPSCPMPLIEAVGISFPVRAPVKLFPACVPLLRPFHMHLLQFACKCTAGPAG